MKKRRELDALIGNRSKRDIGIEYDSLNSSLSSPTPDAYIPPSGSYFAATKRVTPTPGKGCGCTLRRMIRICLPICFLTLVAACITACIGIVWMQVQLKTDVERLSAKIARLETWQSDQPSALNDMKKTMTAMEVDLNNIKAGENGIKNLAAKLATLTQSFEEQIKVPAERLKQIQTESDGTKSELDELKSSVSKLSSDGEGIKTSQGLLTASFEKIQQKIQEIKTEMSDANVKQLNDIASSKQNTEEGIVKLNSTIHELKSNLTTLQHTVDQLKSDNEESQGLLKDIQPITSDLKKDVASLKQDGIRMSQRIVNISNDVSSVKALVAEVNHQGEEIIQAKPSPHSPQKAVDGTVPPDTKVPQVQRQTVTLSELLAEVLNKFETLDTNRNGILSQDELDSYGSKAVTALMKYDRDHNGSLSKIEISSPIPASTDGTNEQKQQGRDKSQR